jgi:protocatechuate 3,4-dioxygenase beta subunit
VQLTGLVTDTFNQGLADAWVGVSSNTTYGEAYTESDGSYSITQVFDASQEEVEVTYSVNYQGVLSERTITVPIVANTTINQSENFAFALATIRLSGTLRDSQGNPVQYTYVYAGDNFYTYTDAAGHYSLEKVVLVTEPTLTWSVYAGNKYNTVTFEVTPGAVIERQENFVQQ